jgi:hypothetical protein
LRLDFESFDINGLTASTENLNGMTVGASAAHMCTDTFTITVILIDPRKCGFLI